ncbi:Pectinesterase [Bertholletia excelsa]
MDKLLFNFIILALLGLLAHGATRAPLCSQTPYPYLCSSLVETEPLGTVDENHFTIRDLSLRVTLDQVQQAREVVMGMDLSSFNQRARLAWADCLELHEDTVRLLNRSIGSTNLVDTQTWLSAAVTNHETCRTGFDDFNMSSYYTSFPLMMGEFSKFLRNSLAINKAAAATMVKFSKQTRGRRQLLSGGFPAWMSDRERKLLESPGVTADIVVAQDGSGNFETISEAVAASRKLSGGKRFVIHVKSGVYEENVVIEESMKNLMMIGDGIGATVVTGNRNSEDGSTTFRSATFAVSGGGFIACDMTFQNTAGPQKRQAVALRSGSDFSIFYRCSFLGYQDTLYTFTMRQFYRECDIYGTVDFIFGNAAVVFQNCNLYVRKPMSYQKNSVTAQGRTDPNQNTGIVVHNSRVTAASDLRPVQDSFRTYLGRPWQKYSRTIFMKSTLDDLIEPAGWDSWIGNFGQSTVYFGEYMNTGAGAGIGGRVKWPGFHVITSPTEARKFTVENFLAVAPGLVRPECPTLQGCK